ncbi:MAG: T9SS type A sorting domain-containing protein [Bacteroidota bacterium]
MKINLNLLCFGFIFSGTVEAQSLSPTVISSGGGFSANGSAMLSSTVGEMAMVETFNNTSVILTQGFQQPEDFNVSIKSVDHSVAGISVFPNPSSGLIKLVFETSEELDLSIVIYDLNGKIIYRNSARKATQNNFIALDLSAFAAGDYILECRNTDNTKKAPVFISQKITLVR